MRKTILTLLIASISVFGCSKSNTTPKSTTTSKPYNMSAKIDGVAFSRDSCIFFKGSKTDSSHAYLVGFAGEPSTRPDYYPTIRINFSDGSYRGVGTYSADLDIWADLGRSQTVGETGDSVNISITSVYPKLVGTFSFKTRKGTAVTSGSFTAMRDEH